MQVREIFETNGWAFAYSPKGGLRDAKGVYLEEDALSYAQGKAPLLPRNYVAWPHNIEHLVASQYATARAARRARDRELSFLSEALHVVTISGLDRWYLAANGIWAMQLPYFPPASIKARLAAIRTRREPNVRTPRVLVVGTYGNAPTAHSMLRIIDAVAAARPNFTLTVAGFGTEQLRSVSGSEKSIEILGAVSDEVLDHLLETSHAALVHQEHGSGALTRIAEFLIAGVPVVATPIAARGYERLEGVSVVESLEDAVAVAGEFISGTVVVPNGVTLDGYRRECELAASSVMNYYLNRYAGLVGG